MAYKIMALCLMLVLIVSLTVSGSACGIHLSGQGDPEQADAFFYRNQLPTIQALTTQWTIKCDNYVELWDDDYATSCSRLIRNGETVTLLGWSRYFAYVQYKSYKGYVYTPYLFPTVSPDLSKWLSVVEPVENYSYESMVEDLNTLQQSNPKLVTLDSIGNSELGRNIPVIRIGSEDASYHVLLQGAIHAREHMTAWLLTAMAEFWITNGIEDQGNICYHIIPMVNPDGVYIAQNAKLSWRQEQIYDRDKSNGYTEENYVMYSRRWKANGLGVDLNRNFPSGWSQVNGRWNPSSEMFKGETPFSAAETIALRDYTLSYDFDVTISYHASGSVIYYEYGENEVANARSRNLARKVESVTGYPMKDSVSLDGAGYKDWVLEELGIPSLTIEIGVWSAPLQLREIYSIFARNLYVMPAIADWLEAQGASSARSGVYSPDRKDVTWRVTKMELICFDE